MENYKVYGLYKGWKVLSFINASNKKDAKEKALLTGDYDKVTKVLLGE